MSRTYLSPHLILSFFFSLLYPIPYYPISYILLLLLLLLLLDITPSSIPPRTILYPLFNIKRGRTHQYHSPPLLHISIVRILQYKYIAILFLFSFLTCHHSNVVLLRLLARGSNTRPAGLCKLSIGLPSCTLHATSNPAAHSSHDS